MTVEDFVAQVPGFAGSSHTEKIKHLAWFLHVHAAIERFQVKHIRDLYDRLHYDQSQLVRDLSRLVDRRPRVLLQDRAGYRLEGKVRQALDAKYGEAPTTIIVAKLLAELPAKVPGIEEREFLQEVIDCHRVRAFRAVIVMMWNLAFDHLVRWVLADAQRLADFNAAIVQMFPKKRIVIKKREDYEELKESEVVDVCRSAKLVTADIKKVIKKELDRRNSAAHPSATVFTQAQAEDTITDLVNNVLLKLT